MAALAAATAQARADATATVEMASHTDETNEASTENQAGGAIDERSSGWLVWLVGAVIALGVGLLAGGIWLRRIR
jgi:hypothetical protein